MSFGHCGIDWLHSLLDCNKQILILPELSFYRYWKILDCESVQEGNEIFSLWMKHFNSKNRLSPDVRMLHSAEENKEFEKIFRESLQQNGIGKKEVFKSIHQAYISAKNIDISKVKTIIAHEHVSFPYKEIIKDFNCSNFLLILRDPRASIAGYFKGIKRKVGHLPDYHDYFYNMSVEEWFNSCDIWKHERKRLGKRLMIIQNEKLVDNLQNEMSNLSQWLGIEYTDALLERTFSNGDTPFVDSSYLKKSSALENNYFSPENVKKRWMSELYDHREILMIETLFEDIMNEFGYKIIHELNLFNKIKGVYYFLIPHRGPKRLKHYQSDQNEFQRYRLRLIKTNQNYKGLLFKLLPSIIKGWIIWTSSFTNHCRMYFFPGNRWERYDNHLLEGTYRNE